MKVNVVKKDIMEQRRLKVNRRGSKMMAVHEILLYINERRRCNIEVADENESRFVLLFRCNIEVAVATACACACSREKRKQFNIMKKLYWTAVYLVVVRGPRSIYGCPYNFTNTVHNSYINKQTPKWTNKRRWNIESRSVLQIA